MATLTQYNFVQEINFPSVLVSNIQNSSIIVALDHIDTIGMGPSMQVAVWFKDVLSISDIDILNSLMSAYIDPPPTIPTNIVTTQFELNNKDLKLARGTATVDETQKAIVSIKVPGTFGETDGRYVAGGYAITEDYQKNDYATVRVEDTDRLIAWAVAQSQNPDASEPVSDEIIKGMGIIPFIGESLTNYPIVKSYTDDDLSPINQGWYFWPLAQGNGLPPVGECEIEPIGGYGFLPSGLYLVITYNRTINTGSVNVNIWWGKLE